MIYKVGQILTLKKNNNVKFIIREITNYDFVAGGKSTHFTIQNIKKNNKFIVSIKQMDIFLSDSEIRKTKLIKLKNGKLSI